MTQPLTKIVVTGADGFLGWHMRCLLHSVGASCVSAVDRARFEDESQLSSSLDGADVVYHLAGINRGTDNEVEAGNREIAMRLCDAMSRMEVRPVVVFANSVHAMSDFPYGRGKRHAGEVIEKWCQSKGAPYSNCYFPHLFGEGAKPFYNSVFATICRCLADGVEPDVNPAGSVELLHAQDACDMMIDAASQSRSQEIRPRGRKLSVAELVQLLRSIRDMYANRVLPDLSDDFTLALFNSLRSYLHSPVGFQELLANRDDRGWLFEAVRGGGGGQSFVSMSHSGVVRGNHYHRRKVERFVVLQGQACIRIRRLFDNEIVEYRVSDEIPVSIDMPTLHTHSITNVGKSELVTLFWAHEIFDPERPDTFREPVQ